MKLKEIEKFIDLAKEKGVAKLSYEEDDKKISVSFVAEATSAYQSVPMQSAVISTSASPGNENTVNSLYKEIKSPFVGTFYRSSSPESDSFVKIGDNISSGQVLCIIEAMKIMNEIEAEISGEIVEICVENETYVEFGQILFKVK